MQPIRRLHFTRTCGFSAGLMVLLVTSAVFGDVFDDHNSYWLRKGTEDLKPAKSISMRDGLSLDPISSRISSPCIVVKTDEDNLAKALVTWGFRKSKADDGSEVRVPVVLIERYVTYRGDRQNLTVATGKDVMLFPGFAFNFDIGQVVPKGQGEDIHANEKGALEPIGEAKLFGLNGPAAPGRDEGKYPDPKSHAGVQPTDFAGSWRVRIDGRWDGRWELDVDGRSIYGRFISDETKSVYEVSGKVAGRPNNARFDIELANAAQSIDAFLWTKDKSAMAGVVTMADRKLGFYATRVHDK